MLNMKKECNNITCTCSNYCYIATFSSNSNTDDAW